MKTIEYFYSSHSGFAYFGSARFRQIATVAGAKVIHRPVDLRALLEAVGPGPTGLLTEARREYFFGREVARWSQYRNAPIKHLRPTWHDHDLAQSSGMLLVAIEQNLDIDSLAHEMLTAHWRDDADLINEEHLKGIAVAAGLDPEPLLARAMSPEIQARFRDNTSEAIERYVFGSPTYFLDGDMFYGQDRLDLLERALVKPFD
ncbi:MAG: 2-hydroxychromene-2-carboxylate isomerase [Burkholderiaceae bacterium]